MRLSILTGSGVVVRGTSHLQRIIHHAVTLLLVAVTTTSPRTTSGLWVGNRLATTTRVARQPGCARPPWLAVVVHARSYSTTTTTTTTARGGTNAHVKRFVALPTMTTAPSSSCLTTTTTSLHASSVLSEDGNKRSGSSVITTTTAQPDKAAAMELLSPVLVVGATGRVGRRVVQQLLGQDIPVRAMVRDRAKAVAIFGTSTGFVYPPLEIVVADLARYHLYQTVLEHAVQGCRAIVVVSGAVRFAQWTDFVLPWRLFRFNVTMWADYDHPYYGNYLGPLYLIQLATKYKVPRFVRLTGLGLAYSALHPFSILFNALLSLHNRWGILCEQALVKSGIPYVILRPGGLADNARDMNQTNVQVDPSGKLPFPGRIGRTDVAALCVAAVMDLPLNCSHTLACRWCGDNIQPRPQGHKQDGYATAQECMRHLAQSGAVSAPAPQMKPYGVVALLTVYTLAAIMINAFAWIGKVLVRPRFG